MIKPKKLTPHIKITVTPLNPQLRGINSGKDSTRIKNNLPTQVAPSIITLIRSSTNSSPHSNISPSKPNQAIQARDMITDKMQMQAKAGQFRDTPQTNTTSSIFDCEVCKGLPQAK